MNCPLSLCPVCHSDKTYPFENIYQNVLTNNYSELYLKNIRFSGERDKKKFRDLMLVKTSPPIKPSIERFDLLISLVGGIVGMVIGVSCNEVLKAFFSNNFQPLILVFTLTGYITALYLSYQHRVLKQILKWEVKMKKWQESWICLNCGNFW